jgi:hypothetical protein
MLQHGEHDLRVRSLLVQRGQAAAGGRVTASVAEARCSARRPATHAATHADTPSGDTMGGDTARSGIVVRGFVASMAQAGGATLRAALS